MAKPRFDPSTVTVRPAATVMLLENRPDLHVLLLRRRAASEFVPGMLVFPGGGVDEADASPEVDAMTPGLSDAAASARLGLPRGGLAYWVAAIRETFEEAGVLLASPARDRGAVDWSDPAVAERFAALRGEVDAGRVRLADAARDEGLLLDVERVHYAARWITPVGPPRRYDTRFFVAASPRAQEALHCDRETVDSEWIRPGDALARYEAGELAMLPPTFGMLRVLADYACAEDAVAAAARQEDGPDAPARLASDGEQWRVLLPGDDDYETGATFAIQAWLRFKTAAADAA